MRLSWLILLASTANIFSVSIRQKEFAKNLSTVELSGALPYPFQAFAMLKHLIVQQKLFADKKWARKMAEGIKWALNEANRNTAAQKILQSMKDKI